jgi:microcystin-dependent protein
VSEAFMGEIRLFSFNYPPKYWAFCDGAVLNINSNQALFSLLGTIYGGNGTTTFALPNLQGRTPLGFSNTSQLGTPGGEAQHTLLISEIPAHNHGVQSNSTTAGGNNIGANEFFGASTVNIYGPISNPLTIEQNTVNMAGNNLAHNNMQPSLALNFCICLMGLFPSPG